MYRSFKIALAMVLVMPIHLSAALAEGSLEQGEKVFKRCAACHAATDQNKTGPGLAGIVGRTAGKAADYNYSPGLASSTLVWDEKTLDSFLQGPRKLVPGTKMTLSVPKPDERQSVILYLKSLAAGN
ncbi:c-type cytochrome [Sinorhizobium mexicanum]|uniref:Cytochrome c family protein n=1 Tax=Sinorhizobium mexicanum TaxID=375549 RepID=A0A859QW67_9HYPH|nr:cytochrome c family protein [Sinorhizobium mexicanum]MBP1881805.1 cytochrome c [Sinorhizobium mexicanum]QLL61558.1 cytochrome c family protein [Sinorhizobium mexicanum]